MDNLNIGHRERLRQKFIEHKITDNEILELLLCYAVPRRDMKPVMKRLLVEFGNIRSVMNAPIERLKSIKGIGQSTAIFIKAVHELMLLGHRHYFNENPVFRDYESLCNYCKAALGGKPIEEFHVLYLDANYRLISDDTHSTGTIDWAAVYPREILKRALDLNSRHVILLHNHPEQSPVFSGDDLRITKALVGILKVVGIEVFDHLLVSGDTVYSAKNLGIL